MKKPKCLSAYDRQSHFLLNKFTLRIRDPEITEQLAKRRADRYDSLFYPTVVT